jgi:hypothetical protein
MFPRAEWNHALAARDVFIGSWRGGVPPRVEVGRLPPSREFEHPPLPSVINPKTSASVNHRVSPSFRPRLGARIGACCGIRSTSAPPAMRPDDVLLLLSFLKRGEANMTHRLPLRCADRSQQNKDSCNRQGVRLPPGHPQDGRGRQRGERSRACYSEKLSSTAMP